MHTIENQIESLVDAILMDYRNQRDIDKMDLKRHPDKDVVIDMIPKLLRIVYPGYTRDKAYRIYNAKHNLSMLIEDVMYNLNEQISLILGNSMEEAEARNRKKERSARTRRLIQEGAILESVFPQAQHMDLEVLKAILEQRLGTKDPNSGG